MIGAGLFAILAVVYGVFSDRGIIELAAEQDKLAAWIDGIGFFGPLAIITLITLAIVFSPIPSAPVALAAGAVYGHGWGALYVLLGAELGALIAFILARLLGHELLRRWLGERLSFGLLGSQNKLMGIVFLSRMLPFISFDLVSYAAGLSVLSFWRFALATLAGIIPMSFLLAHFGSDLASGDQKRMAITILLLGVITAGSFVIGIHRRSKNGK